MAEPHALPRFDGQTPLFRFVGYSFVSIMPKTKSHRGVCICAERERKRWRRGVGKKEGEERGGRKRGKKEGEEGGGRGGWGLTRRM
jgi:hypothetical protein